MRARALVSGFCGSLNEPGQILRDLGRFLQKMKPLAVEQRLVACLVPLSPLICFLTVLLALWAFIPFAELMETWFRVS